MAIYTTQQLDSLAQLWQQAGIDLPSLIKANAMYFKAKATEGTPSPQPQKAYPDGATENQKKCADVAYILYQIELLDPKVDANQAFQDYCANHASCFEA
ncbi:MAG: hypothetical protein JJ916_04295 [Phycisphaerales bacterium]|nr:hypothetical protein [Phycisphaerales bacterium]